CAVRRRRGAQRGNRRAARAKSACRQEPPAPRPPEAPRRPGPSFRGGVGMISCGELVGLLCDYLSDELPPERRDHADHHLRHCPSCAAYLQSYTALIQLTRSLPAAPLPPRLARRLADALAAQQRGA